MSEAPIKMLDSGREGLERQVVIREWADCNIVDIESFDMGESCGSMGIRKDALLTLHKLLDIWFNGYKVGRWPRGQYVKAGDKILCIKSADGWLTAGKLYEAVEVNSVALYVIDDLGDRFRVAVEQITRYFTPITYGIVDPAGS